MLRAGVQVPDKCRQQAEKLSGSVVTIEEEKRCLEMLSSQSAESVR